MQKLLALSLSLLLISSTQAQDAQIKKLQAESLRHIKHEMNDSLQKNWRLGLLYSIQLGQSSLSNWASGGDDFSFSISTSFNTYASYKKGRSRWDNGFDLNFGYLNSSSLGGRKNDDRIDLVTKYVYALNKKLYLSTLVNFRSQLLNGFSYEELGKNYVLKKFSSAFLSPAYIVASQGLDYRPNTLFSLFISPITSRWVVVRDDSLAAKGEYGVEPGRKSNSQVGAFATLHFQKSFNKYVTYKGRMDLFSNYKSNPGNADLYFTNSISARIARAIAFSWNVDMIYDDDVELFGKNGTSPALQFKSVIGVGLQVRI